jgi:hypothetical protein
MGLAWSSGKGAWSVRRRSGECSSSNAARGDRQKTLKAHGAVVSDKRLPAGIVDFRQIPSVEGRVIVHGEDEQSSRHYLILEGVDARVTTSTTRRRWKRREHAASCAQTNVKIRIITFSVDAY